MTKTAGILNAKLRMLTRCRRPWPITIHHHPKRANRFNVGRNGQNQVTSTTSTAAAGDSTNGKASKTAPNNSTNGKAQEITTKIASYKAATNTNSHGTYNKTPQAKSKSKSLSSNSSNASGKTPMLTADCWKYYKKGVPGIHPVTNNECFKVVCQIPNDKGDICGRTYMDNGSTTQANKHLATDHNMTEFQPFKLRQGLKDDDVIVLLAKFVVNQYLPYRIVEDKFLKVN